MSRKKRKTPEFPALTKRSTPFLERPAADREIWAFKLSDAEDRQTLLTAIKNSGASISDYLRHAVMTAARRDAS